MHKKIMTRKFKTIIVWILVAVMQLTNLIPAATVFADEAANESQVVEEVADEELPGENKEDGQVEPGKTSPPAVELEEEKGVDEKKKESPAKELQEASGGKDLGNIFTFDSFKINEIEADENQVVEIKDGTKVKLGYTWAVGSDVKSGDWSEIDVPDAFKLDKNFKDLDIKLYGGEVVGKYSLIDNKIKFVFDEKIEAVAPVENGILGFEVKFNEEIFQEDVVTDIEFKDKGSKTITIIAKPSGEISSIAKLGKPDSKKDAKTITWVVDVTNPSNIAIEDAKLKDLLPAGLELDLSSVGVKDLNIKLNGDLIEGDKVTSLSPTIDGQNFELELPTVGPYKGYRVEYTTDITVKNITEFTNKASFEHGGKELPAKSTVNIERSSSIEKYGKKINDTTISWTIDINKSLGSIDKAIVEDTLPAGLTLKPETMKIFKLSQDGDNWTESDSDREVEEFPVILGTIDEAYRIKFETAIDYSEVNDGNYKKDNSFTNEAILKDGDNEIGNAEKTVEITRDSILSKTGKQYVDYENKEIKWTVTVNKANHKIDNAIVKDILPKGLTISEDDIKVSKASQDITGDVTIEVPTNNGTTSTKVTINLGDITEKHTIEYTTKITDFNIDEFLNKASLGGTGVGTGGTINPVPVKPAKNSYSKSFEGIDYNEKTMSWKTVANPTREAFETLKITDTFPNDGLILLDNSLEVKVGGQKKTLGTDYELTAIDENYKNGFVVKFIGDILPINAGIVMTYKTSYDPEKGIKPNTGNGLYKNEVSFKGKTINGNNVDITRDAQKQVNPETVNTGKKVGKLVSIDSEGNKVDGWISGNKRKIEWEVYTNYLKQDLGKGVSITDKLEYEGKIDKDSIQVRKYTVKSGGGTDLAEKDINVSNLQLMTSISTDKYNVIMGENNRSFTLNFNENVDERYAVTFTTSVSDISQETYKNTAHLIVGDKKYPYTGTVKFKEWNKKLSKESLNTDGKNVYTDDEINWKIKINESLSIIDKDVKIVDTISKGMVYKKGSLKVYKLQGEERVLVEEEYKLKESTNEDGKTILEILFLDSISSTYEIEYTTVVIATEGEINNSVEYSGKNEKIDTKTTKKLNASQFSYVGGYGNPKQGAIIISKVDSDGDPITAEAEFEVYYILNGEERLVSGESFKTNKDGKIKVPNLVIGNTYYIREMKAPNGFKFDENFRLLGIKIEQAAGKNNSGAYEYNIKNENIKTDITGIKAWEGGPELSIYLQLYRDGGKYDQPVRLEKGTYEYVWENLDLTDNAGNEYTYTVKEVDKDGEDFTPKNYKKVENGLTVTNTYVIPKTQITGRKVWKGGSSKKPTIKLQLYKDGQAFKDPVVLKDGVTSYTWAELDKTDINGKEHVYTVDEVKTPENYGKSRSEDKLTVTNTYESPVSDVTGRKVWEGGPELSIYLQLYRDGGKYDQPVRLEKGTYEYVWENLDLTDNAGNEYTYTVKEVNKDGKDFTPENYEKAEEGLTVTNTYVIPKTQITGTKVWKGGSSNKPTIKLQLYKDGQAFKDPVELKDGVTSYTWTELDKTDINGKEHVYTVDEVEVPYRYRKTISKDGLTITNERIPDSHPPVPRGGTLLLEKNVSGNKADKDKKFEFTLNFQSDDQYYFYDGSGGMSDGVIFNGETVELAHGESILIRGIPEGTSYTIREADYSSEGYVMSEQGSRGIVDGDKTAKVSFTNTKGEEPVDPKDPEDPDPEKPVEPVDPENPEPTDPTEPTRPTDPRDPEDPPSYTELPDPNDPDSPDKVIIVDEDSVQLGSYTKKENPDGTFIYIEDGDRPLGQTDYKPDDTKGLKDPNAPQTGDNTPVIPLLIVFITSLLGTAYLLIIRKKKYS